MPGLPKTREEFIKAGWKYSSTTNCRKCRAIIEFWVTPNKRWAPMNSDLTSHFASCPSADHFRSKKT